MSNTTLGRDFLDEVDVLLAPADRALAADYPGDDGSRQPVHTVYVPADVYRAGLASEWGERARTTVEDAGGVDAVLDAAQVPASVRAEVGARVWDKLVREPVEDLRIDFEDGYGDRPQAEDGDALAVARQLALDEAAGTGTPFVGIRFKCLELPTRARGLRTLDLFVGELLDQAGTLPPGLVLTLPKVTSEAQVAVMATILARLESGHGLAPGRLRFEVQVETAPAILGSDGTATVARMVRAGAGRVSGLHYGTYDYSAGLGIAAPYQSLEHPAADHAKAVMQLAAAGTGVRLSDGSTNVVPAGGRDRVVAAWQLHARLVHRSLTRGFYQGWDMHPGHLPSRYAATYAFFREGFVEAAGRLGDYRDRREGAVMDEPATARALAAYLLRGLDCGASTAAELDEQAGLRPVDLAALSGRSPVDRTET